MVHVEKKTETLGHNQLLTSLDSGEKKQQETKAAGSQHTSTR